MANSLFIMRLPQVLAKIGLSRASLYAQISAGLFPKQINLGSRTVGWLSYEIEAILSARIKSMSNEEIKQLVAQMHLKRNLENSSATKDQEV
ncbi:phage-related protein [Vibrio maritimus]|uniref:Phage-related protein n=1 Tax=Vibrio maritimus TaxID=990268 RepID=A0A090S4Q0_9VIBR|nr:phage-related protein [Vibrio maritimus]